MFGVCMATKLYFQPLWRCINISFSGFKAVNQFVINNFVSKQTDYRCFQAIGPIQLIRLNLLQLDREDCIVY